MGRRKIEIKAIKDDRNRSVTFLKRKGGLFKKAHELAVLTSVDVAVLIVGQNNKLYEYSSGNLPQFLERYQYARQAVCDYSLFFFPVERVLFRKIPPSRLLCLVLMSAISSMAVLTNTNVRMTIAIRRMVMTMTTRMIWMT